MYTKILPLLFFFLLIAGCTRDNPVEFNYDKDIPEWLEAKIDSMDKEYYCIGSEVVLYQWERKYFYHISIPASSCAFCELYNQAGNKVTIANSKFQSFIDNKKQVRIIWKWNKIRKVG